MSKEVNTEKLALAMHKKKVLKETEHILEEVEEMSNTLTRLPKSVFDTVFARDLINNRGKECFPFSIKTRADFVRAAGSYNKGIHVVNDAGEILFTTPSLMEEIDLDHISLATVDANEMATRTMRQSKDGFKSTDLDKRIESSEDAILELVQNSADKKREAWIAILETHYTTEEDKKERQIEKFIDEDEETVY